MLHPKSAPASVRSSTILYSSPHSKRSTIELSTPLSQDRVDVFVSSFLAFSHGSVVSDKPRAPGVEIGRPTETYRRVRIESKFGKLTAFVTDGHLPYPYGRASDGHAP